MPAQPTPSKNAAAGHQHKGGHGSVHGADEARRAAKHQKRAQRNQHATGAAGNVIGTEHAGNEGSAERQSLRQEKGQRDFCRLKLKRQKRKDASPNRRRVHRQKARIGPNWTRASAPSIASCSCHPLRYHTAKHGSIRASSRKKAPWRFLRYGYIATWGFTLKSHDECDSSSAGFRYF